MAGVTYDADGRCCLPANDSVASAFVWLAGIKRRIIWERTAPIMTKASIISIDNRLIYVGALAEERQSRENPAAHDTFETFDD